MISRTRWLAVSLLISISLAACSEQVAIAPTATPTNAPTETFTPSPTLTATLTLSPTATNTSLPTSTSTSTPTSTPLPTSTPTLTSPPRQTSLTGLVLLSGAQKTPLATSVELHQGESFTLIAQGETDATGRYRIANIAPGTYELWILITERAAMPSGCQDVLVPDSTWRLGIKFGEGKALTMPDGQLGKALLLAANLAKAPTLQATGFYAVLPGLVIASGIETRRDTSLMCT